MDEWNEQLVDAIKRETMSEYNSRMKNYEFMVISNIEELEGKASTEYSFIELLKERIKLNHPTLLLSTVSGHEAVEKIFELYRFAVDYKIVRSETH